MIKRILPLFLFSLLLVLFTGCFEEDTITSSTGSEPSEVKLSISGKSEVETGEPITLTANVTSNEEGLRYFWKEGSGSWKEGTTKKSFGSKGSEGTYTFYFKVETPTQTKETNKKVTVVDPSTALTLSLSAEKSQVKPGESIKLNASVSAAESGLEYFWRDGSSGSWESGSKSKTYSKSSEGSYTFYFKVKTPTQEKQTSTTVKVSNQEASKYPIHSGINASTFWAGEGAGDANHNISNVPSAWESDWATSFGVEDWPGLSRDSDYIPTDSRFTGDEYPKVNPYYFALPYNDMSEIVYDGDKVSNVVGLQSDYTTYYIPYLSRDGVKTTDTRWLYGYTRKGSATKIPWKDQSSWGDNRSMVKGRWARIRYKGGDWVYAQWLDAGPYHYDDTDYIFGDGTTKPRNQNPAYGQEPYAGIDLSPSVMLKMGVVDPNSMAGWEKDTWNKWGTSITDGSIEWQFVDDADVPNGPWKRVVADNETHWN